MNGFAVRDGELVIGGMTLSALAERVGRTPFYAHDARRIAARVAEVRAALPPGARLHYAVKANPLPALVTHLCGLVDGLDVASGGELALALRSGGQGAHMSFAGPAKQAAELEQSVAAGVLVNIESFREVPLLAAASERLGRAARVAVRVNPDFELRGAGMAMGGGPKPFGVDAEQVPELLRAIGSAGLAFEGFHVFPGSQMLHGERLAVLIEQSWRLVQQLAQDAPRPLQHVNLGGGWGISYTEADRPLNLLPVSQALAAVQTALQREAPGARLVIELGRYLVGEAGVYVARVIDRKVSRGEVFLVTDGGLHHNLAATGNFGQVIRRHYPLVVGNRMDTAERERVSVVGPLCTPLDRFAERVALAPAQPGDLVVVFQSGAYGASASPSAFLGHPACADVLV
jgi:diaminopimelate decarboxylase